jgi:transcriptional regulator NrdR family protein
MDAIDPKACPVCGARMRQSGGRKAGSYIRKYRACPDCNRRDTILVEPERVVKVRVVRGRTQDAELADEPR